MSRFVPATPAQVAALALALCFATLVSVELRTQLALRRRWTWPVLAVAATVGVGSMGSAYTTAPLRALYDGGVRTVAILALVAAGLAGLLVLIRRRPSQALLMAATWFTVAAVSWVPTDTAPYLRSYAGTELRLCLTSSSRYTTFGGQIGLWADMVPNAVLYVPFGIAAMLLVGRRAWAALLVVMGTSVFTEVWQATMTDRVCAPNDVMTNTLGGLLGVASIALLGLAQRPA